jgi:hypothetical protein
MRVRSLYAPALYNNQIATYVIQVPTRCDSERGVLVLVTL